jgi:Holliday junction DNA helicase RuvA
MIASLSGTLSFTAERFLVLNVGGVGYKIFTTGEVIRTAQKKTGEALFWTHLSVRETSLDLYGFLEQSELEFFELLLTVSGIGPKTALGIMNAAPVEMIVSAVTEGDSSHLTKVSGIGTKNAQKIVMELKGKVDRFRSETPSGEKETDALEALEALGYSLREAREVLKKISPEAETPGEKIKEALKILGK